MKSSEILRKAARLVESGKVEYGCIAIREVLFKRDGWRSYLEHSDAPREWLKMFKPDKLSICGGYWGHKQRGPRIIGLCLAAAIAESEGD